MSKLTKEELILSNEVKAVFDANPGADKLHVTSDLQIFLPEGYSYANDHAHKHGEDLFEIKRSEMPEAKKPEVKKPEVKKPETETPETETPETETPETETPETKTPAKPERPANPKTNSQKNNK